MISINSIVSIERPEGSTLAKVDEIKATYAVVKYIDGQYKGVRDCVSYYRMKEFKNMEKRSFYQIEIDALTLAQVLQEAYKQDFHYVAFFISGMRKRQIIESVEPQVSMMGSLILYKNVDPSETVTLKVGQATVSMKGMQV